jgi:hypothetical protein
MYMLARRFKLEALTLSLYGEMEIYIHKFLFQHLTLLTLHSAADRNEYQKNFLGWSAAGA